ncbi:nicotinamide mononucleotide transporter [Eupransor demetentiae]|uniref:Nicotinamide riboside transporter PnuC (PnuC) n=1 Tax=Eupransor demetentiae TaxID=3109584 RepID=A0ABM9N6Q7_9LACO|nr:Nicotinamide riboside transporter PnuC (PnuC) [Lactobacillaceae bacterium LMG 33000]
MKKLNKIANSWWFDLVGVVVIVLSIAAASYVGSNGHDIYNRFITPLSASWLFKGVSGSIITKWPLIGIFALLSAVASVMSTRLVAKKNNLGNTIGWINIFFSGVLDFLFGNVGAMFTYPLSWVLNYIPSRTWKKYDKDEVTLVSVQKMIIFLITSTALSFGLNALAYVWLGQGLNAIFWFTSISLAFSFVADMLNVFKSSQQWIFWALYNISQLVKSLFQFNFANVGKYIFYIINSVIVGITWFAKKEESK